jgi:hypothetical protein
MTGSEVKSAAPAAPTQVYTARRTGQDYAWFSAAWANHLFDVKEFQVDPADVYLFRYEVRDKELLLQAIDHKFVAHQIIDGGITGTVRSDDNLLVNRVTGPARPEILDLPDLFSKDVAHFSREKAKP